MYKLAIAIGIGLIFFVLAYWRGNLKNHVLSLSAANWLVPYLGGLFLISYLGSFGGKGVIPFGWDFLVMALFSTVILYFAVRNRSASIAKDYAAVEGAAW